MNWVDLLIAGAIAWTTFRGLKTGLIRQAVWLVAVLLGLYLAGALYDDLSANLEFLIDDETTRNLVSFVAIIVGSVIAGMVIGEVLRTTATMLMLGPVDSHGGGAVGFMRGLVYVQLALFAFAVFTALRRTIINNIWWVFTVTIIATVLGLAIAVLADRSGAESIAKSLIFMPMAISFVGASVIWRFVYDYRGEGDTQIGILNAIITGLGMPPQAWITLPVWNSIFLMVILIWIQTGFAMVILSAALRGIPEETLEAARIDGANDFRIFFDIMIPQVWGTIVVVWTTITIVVLKVFDIIFALTNGQWDTEVLANLMFKWMFANFDYGRGSAIAVVIMLAVLPIMIWNIRQANRESGGH